MGSGPAFAFGDVVPVRTQPIFAPLQSDLRFFLLCCPHRRRNILRCTYPLRGAIWIYPVPLERRGRLGPPLTPTVLVTHDGRNPSNPCSLQEEPRSILGSFRITTLTGICVFWHSGHTTKPSPISALCSQIHRFLAVAVPLFTSVGTLSKGFGRIVISPPYLVGYV